MLTVLWLVLAALVIARMRLYFRDRIPKQDDDLDRQIYRLNHVVATAREMDAYQEFLAMAQACQATAWPSSMVGTASADAPGLATRTRSPTIIPHLTVASRNPL